MSVLIAYVGVEWSTAEIAQQIADRLLKAGVAAVVRSVNQIERIDSHQAVVLGSAIQDQEWLPEAAEFLGRFSGELPKLPLWLFSTGSVNESGGLLGSKAAALLERTLPHGAAVAGTRDAIQVRDHRHFAGGFERGVWSSLGDLFLKICGGSPNGDRDWCDVNAWAADIARELQRIDRVKERRRLHLSVRGRP
jgi:menaquinone-dependent protoporphyrinogen oxidase